MDPWRPRGKAEGSSQKARLSYLLNHDEENGRGGKQAEKAPFRGTNRQRNEESRRSGILHQGQSSLHAHGSHSSFHQILNATSPRGTSHLERSLSQYHESPGVNSSGTEKKGVGKKRQRRFICDTCGFNFYTNSDLQKHISSVHLLLRPYECKMCDKKFGERSNATKHFKSVHERQKNAACNQCDKVFAFRDGLVRHVRLVHDNVRNFHCKYQGCGQSFKQSAHLNKHEQTHNKSRMSSSKKGASSSLKIAIRQRACIMGCALQIRVNCRTCGRKIV